ncbi:MAG: DNA repair protein RecO [Patescibacteria group bacterium]|nr:DNA repair protein RecO [Patescibacteria group bacterium]
MRNKSYTLPALIIKRKNVGETDRIVTLLAQEKGKFVAVAKGVRKLNSSKRAFMEPGNIVKAHFIKTKSLPLLIQAKLIHDSSRAKTKLARIRQLTQILEIYDKLFVEQEIEKDLFELILEIRLNVINHNASTMNIQKKLNRLILALGFPPADLHKHGSILEYVSQLTERSMKSFDFLQIK